MKPVLDDITPFSPSRIHDIRTKRFEIIERYYLEKATKPKRKSSTGPRKIALNAEGQAALSKLDPDLQRQVMEALQRVEQRERTNGPKGGGEKPSP